MARYSPGFVERLPDGLTFAMPFALRSGNIIDQDFQPVNTNLSLVENRFGQINAAGQWSGGTGKSLFSSNTIFQNQSFTVFFWVMFSSFASNMIYVQVKLGGSTGVSSWLFRNTGSPADDISFRLKDIDGNPAQVNSGSLNLDQWYGVGGRVDESDVEFWLDGVMVDSDLLGNDIDYDNNNFVIGNRLSGSFPLNGALSEFYYWPLALTDEEMEALPAFYPWSKGSRAGNVIQRSGSSFAIRSRRKPRFQRTVNTSRSRNSFTHVRSNYQLLSGAEQAAFASNAPDFPRVNSLGVPYILAGTSLFSSQNIALVNSGLPINETSQAPVTFPNPSIDDFAMEVQPVDIVSTLSPLNVPTDYLYSIFVSKVLETPPSNPDGIDTFLNGSRSEGQATNVQWGTGWLDRFGDSPNFNEKFVVFKLRQLHVPSGQTRFILTTIVEIGV